MNMIQLPKDLSMIACVDEKNGIGKNGKLLVHIEADMKRFKNLTMNQAVIMGRHTMESLPLGEPLKGRINIALSRSLQGTSGTFGKEGLLQWHNIMNGFLICKDLSELANCMQLILGIYPQIKFWCIGGEMIYRLLLPYTNEIQLTRVPGDYEADTFFPEISKFKCIEKKILSGMSFERHIRKDG